MRRRVFFRFPSVGGISPPQGVVTEAYFFCELFASLCREFWTHRDDVIASTKEAYSFCRSRRAWARPFSTWCSCRGKLLLVSERVLATAEAIIDPKSAQFSRFSASGEKTNRRWTRRWVCTWLCAGGRFGCERVVVAGCKVTALSAFVAGVVASHH